MAVMIPMDDENKEFVVIDAGGKTSFIGMRFVMNDETVSNGEFGCNLLLHEGEALDIAEALVSTVKARRVARALAAK